MPEPPILLLDVMGTLVHEPFFEELPVFFGMSLDELLAVKHPTSWIEFERGEIDEAEYARRFFTDGRDVDLAGLRAHMRASYRWLPGVEALLAELHGAGHVMHALSNYSDWYRMLDEELGLSRFLSWRFVSCATGVRKPDAEAYLGAARALGVVPGACLFADDRPENVQAAREAGMPALRVDGAATLRAGLVRHGVLRA